MNRNCSNAGDRETTEPVTVLVLDTAAGAAAVCDEYDQWWWTEGNGSCDCNRGLAFGYDLPDADTCLGCHRYVVLAVNGGVAPPEYNSGYPEELRRLAANHGPVCPYCGSNTFHNAWGNGNAVCSVCEQEFMVVAQGGRLYGQKVDQSERAPMLFSRWLKLQRERQDAIGELARWFKGLGRGTRISNDPIYYITRLNEKGSYGGAAQALYDAWREYLASLFKQQAVPAEAAADYWHKHYIQLVEVSPGETVGICSLCGNSGVIDTSDLRSERGYEVGRRNYCLCPNGQRRRERDGPDVD